MNLSSLSDSADSTDLEYARRLDRISRSRWRRMLNVQAPYRWNLRRLSPGFVLDLGCGVGRNLHHLDGNGIGVDANPDCVVLCRQAGFRAYLPEEFEELARRDQFPPFDSLLAAHVLEHVSETVCVELLQRFVPHLARRARLILMTPQEAGFKTDPTHVRFVDDHVLEALCRTVGFHVDDSYSFPFPRSVGRMFAYNEFVVVASRHA